MKKFSSILSTIGFTTICLNVLIALLLIIQVFIDLVVLKKDIFYHSDMTIYSIYIFTGLISSVSLFASSIINAVIIHSKLSA